MEKKCYVTMTDKAMSGWGMAKGKINKLVFVCESIEEAHVVANNAKNRGDQENINICTSMPYYNSLWYYVQYKDKDDYPSWYKPGYFTKKDK